MRRRHPKALVAALALLGSLVLGVTLAQGSPPTVSISAPSSVTFNSAHLSGTVNPEDNETFCSFEYAIDPDTEGWSATDCEASVPAGSGPSEVKADLSGLKPGATYRVRLVANNNIDPAVVSGEETFETEAVNPPEAKDLAISSITSSSAHLEGTVNSGGTGAGEGAGSYSFQCSPSCNGIGGEHEFDAEGFADGNDHFVEADITELEPNREYTITLLATNAGGEDEAQETFTTAALAPEIAPTVVFGDGPGAWVIRAELNPHNSEVTDCHFEFGPTTSYGQSLPCEELPGSHVNVLTPVGHRVTSLDPASTYHFRLLAQTADGGPAVSGPDAILETPAVVAPPRCPNEVRRAEQHSTFLPDCRAYEMVSPPEKNGAQVVPYSARTRAAADGDAVAFLSLTGFGDVRGGAIATEYIGVRDGAAANGWSTHAITPGNLEPASWFDNLRGLESRFTGEFSDDLQHATFITKTPLVAGSPSTAAIPKLYRFDDLLAPGPKAPQLLSDCPACTAPLSEDPSSEPAFAGASADFSHVIFESDQSLTLDVPYCEPLPLTERNQCPLHLYEWADGTLRLAGVLPDGSTAANSQAGQGVTLVSSTGNANRTYASNNFSEDGSRIFFTVRGSGAATEGALYMREDNATASPSTVQLNASENSTPNAPKDARYWAATPDGSKVVFTSSEQLTNTPDSGLYMYDASRPDDDPDNLTLLYGGGVEGVIGASDDGSYVYFVTPQPGPTVMVWHDGAVRQVAAVSEVDTLYLTASNGISLTPKSTRMTPDGHHLLFVSYGGASMPHTGAGDTCSGLGPNSPCAEVYAYDAIANDGAGELSCASCRLPASATAQGDADILFAVSKSATTSEAYLNHPLSEDGRFVVFSTAEPLVPEDTNGVVEDVYSYDTITGKAQLISSGTDPFPSFFMDASRDGHDVFFTTRAQLSGWDVDRSVDLYDARVNGGVPDPLPRPAPCAGTECRGDGGPRPTEPSGVTATFSGPASSQAKRQHRKNRKKHRKVKRHAKRHQQRANHDRGGAK